MRKIGLALIVILPVLCSSSVIDVNSSAYELAKKMFQSARELTSLEYEIKKSERINGEMITQISTVKLALDPYRVYTRQKSPNDGVEVLFCEGKHNNEAVVNPAGFPWITMNLDPLGSTMRHNQHHTILNSGFDHVVSILEHQFTKLGKEVESMVQFGDPVIWNDMYCDVIEFNNPYFRYITHRVKPGETVLTIADSLKLSEYMIVDINEEVDDYHDVFAGQEIRIPTYYAPKMIIYINKKLLVPVMMKISDDKGVYEIYEYRDLKVNPKFDPDEFSVDYEEYDF